jgi:hypothetical protein
VVSVLATGHWPLRHAAVAVAAVNFFVDLAVGLLDDGFAGFGFTSADDAERAGTVALGARADEMGGGRTKLDLAGDHSRPMLALGAWIECRCRQVPLSDTRAARVRARERPTPWSAPPVHVIGVKHNIDCHGFGT